MKQRKTPQPPLSDAVLTEAIRDLSDAPVDPAFASRLRQEFTSGRIARTPERSLWRRFPRLSILRWAVAPAAAAALVASFLVLNQSPTWTLVPATKQGSVIIDGREFTSADPSTLERQLHHGSSIRLSEDAGLVLLCRGTLLLELAPGTEATIPRAPGRWWGRAVDAELKSGELRILTGPKFQGARLSTLTSEGRTDLAGTIVSVYREELLTCVCVLESAAWVGRDEGDMEKVPAGMRKVMFGDGSEPVVTTIEPEHGRHLEEFRDRYSPMMQEAGR